jgi:WD repeat-containing protein 53
VPLQDHGFVAMNNSQIVEAHSGIRSQKFRGHSGSVLCLDHCSSLPRHLLSSNLSDCFLSGSEDKTCRLWDVRTTKTSICIQCADEVLAVAFGGTVLSDDYHEDTIFSKEFNVYTTVDKFVYVYDLRKACSPIISEPTHALFEATDEINQICLAYDYSHRSSISDVTHQKSRNRKGDKRRNKKQFDTSDNNSSLLEGSSEIISDLLDVQATILATGDDAGIVHVEKFSSDSKIIRNSFTHGTDQSPAMVTSIAIQVSKECQNYKRKQANSLLLASGGTDCQIKLWDISNFSKTTALQTCTIRTSDTGTNQVCNPPMVHNLHWSPSGRLLSAALGDGSIGIWAAHEQNRTNPLVLISRLEEAHNGPVASCLFPEWGQQSSCGVIGDNLERNDRLLCTVGNDCNIVFWDLGLTVGGEKAIDPSLIFHKANNSKPPVDEVDEYMQIDQPTAFLRIQHSAKPNWTISNRGFGNLHSATLYVADTGSDITGYVIPLT